MKTKKLSELTVNEWVSGGILLLLMLWWMSSCSENPKNQTSNDLDNQMAEIQNDLYNTCMNGTMGDPLLKDKKDKSAFCKCFVKYYSNPDIRSSLNFSSAKNEDEHSKFIISIAGTCGAIVNGMAVDNLK